MKAYSSQIALNLIFVPVRKAVIEDTPVTHNKHIGFLVSNNFCPRNRTDDQYMVRARLDRGLGEFVWAENFEELDCYEVVRYGRSCNCSCIV